MSRRFHRGKERPLPERPRLDPPPDFIPHVVALDYGAEMPPPPSCRAFALDGPCLRVYAEHKVAAHQRCVGHWPMQVNRFGHGWCRCGAQMWSPWWVAEGLYGLASALSGTGVKVVAMPEHEDDPIEEIDEAFDGTGSWIVEHEETWKSRVSTVERNEP